MRIRISCQRALSFCLCVALSGAANGHAQVTGAVPAPPAAAAPAAANKILSKDPDYLKLLNPPVGDDLLRTYSQSYQKKTAEIEAKVADITDEKVRSQTREDEWAKVTKRERLQFQYEADVALNNARASFSQSHRDAWFEVGRGTYDESAAAYVVRAAPSAPMTMNFMTPMSRASLNQVYEKFHQIAAPEIEQQARAYVSQSGANSNCARNADLCFQLKSNEIEQGLRPARIVVVAQGDLEQQKIDRLLIVDYETEGILLELDPHVPILNPVIWRFSIGKVLPPPAEPEPPAAAVPPAPAVPAAGTEKAGDAEPAPNAPVLPAGLPRASPFRRMWRRHP